MFKLEKDAKSWLAQTTVGKEAGTFTAPSKSITVAEAAANWLTYIENEKREPTTLRQYRQHAQLHINPRLGKLKLASLTTPRIEAFRDELLSDPNIKRPTAKKVLQSLKAVLKEAQRRGLASQNVAAPVALRMANGAKKLTCWIDTPLPS